MKKIVAILKKIIQIYEIIKPKKKKSQ